MFWLSRKKFDGRTAVRTSSTLAQRAMNAGNLSIDPFHTRRCS